MKFNVSAAAFAFVSIACGTEKTRQYLHGVNIKTAPEKHGGVLLSATNGHILLWAYDKHGTVDCSNHEFQSLIVDVNPKQNVHAKPMLKACKSKLYDRLILRDGGEMSVEDGDNLATWRHIGEPPIFDMAFPSWEKVVPLPTFDVGPMGGISSINIKKINEAQKYSQSVEGFLYDPVKAGRSGGCAIFKASDEISAILISFNRMPDAGGVVMPMRVNSDFKQNQMWRY